MTDQLVGEMLGLVAETETRIVELEDRQTGLRQDLDEATARYKTQAGPVSAELNDLRIRRRQLRLAIDALTPDDEGRQDADIQTPRLLARGGV